MISITVKWETSSPHTEKCCSSIHFFYAIDISKLHSISSLSDRCDVVGWTLYLGQMHLVHLDFVIEDLVVVVDCVDSCHLVEFVGSCSCIQLVVVTQVPDRGYLVEGSEHVVVLVKGCSILG